MNTILYSKGGNDECYTPDYGVKPILKYIPRDAVIWCPFDTEESEFVKQISKTNKVIFSHIDNGQDFFLYEPEEEWDIIISNPPFSNKRLYFERTLSFNKPIALIMTLTWMNDSGSKICYRNANREMQLLLFDNRMKFNSPDRRPNDKITFSSAYYCSDFLPKDIILGGRLNTPK